ncbi:MarR family winged helix-turn-helix transcriptional regulator [Levilactobacillus brevis]|uniref:MarR family transcriptional regulator n=1 Tax=Levilactobacillus brevis TaxID=1580 RepID=A0AA41JSY3_LEVBR|nr:helix-turn-helix domain-containing protein [Levilactobacillus brevis]KID43685.1 hypothetical protein LbDm2_1852 [Levilactobacillus brevis]MBS0947285.1 MarR family transcriptional regulator [Levilactobacillus brevis]MBS0978429.1 MarR family transcriptional regulator [Levilactobacillus brevis]MBS1010430.1 MarR family transcriptional regulator [Levilactobacillus brevis]MCT3583459.1 MarR family transcriptional regulator [Levilactobacillus brevis]
MTHHFYETCAYFTAARYMRTVESLATQTFKPTGMKPAYAYIMLALEDHHPQTVTELATTLGYDRSSIYRMVQRLESQALLHMTTVGKSAMIDLLPASTTFLKTANQCLDTWGALTSEKLGPDKAMMTQLLTTNNEKLRR